MDKASIKPQKGDAESSRLVNPLCTGGFCTPNSMRTETPVLRTLLDPALCVFSSGWSLVSFNMLCDKQVIK